MPKARSSDRSLASLSRPRCPPTSFLPFSSRVPVAFGTPDFGVATERGAPSHREKYEQPRARASGRGWMEVREGVERQRGATVGGGYPTRYLNLRLPRGRAQKCKAIVSRPRPVSSSAGSLLYPSWKGVTYRDTRESTEGLDISRRSVAVVAAWFRARFTARERTTYGIPVEVRFLSLSLLLARLLTPLYMCLLCLSRRSPTIFFFYRRNGSAGVADLRRAKFERRSYVFSRYFR